MDWLTPSSPEALAGRLSVAGGALLPTGAAEPPSRLPEAAAGTGAVGLSTSGLAGGLEIRPGDLTVTVGAEARVADLLRACRERDVWLPLGGPAAAASVGGAVAAAAPGPWDGSHGDLRRQLLSCDLVTWSGHRARWGRDVMKNVAGYGLTRAVAGAFGRLGVVHRVTLRLWPEPAHHRRVRLGPPGGDGSLELAGAAVRGDLDAAVRPDAVVWSRDPGGTRLAVHLLGSEDSVELRRTRLAAWADARGADIREEIDVWRAGDGSGEPAGPDAAASGPGVSAVSRERPPDVSVVTVADDRSDFDAWGARVVGALGDALVAAEGYPLSGQLRCAYRRDGGEGAEGAMLDRLLEAAGDAPVRVERGTGRELARVSDRRPDGVRRLEGRVVDALDGRPRHWLSAYV